MIEKLKYEEMAKLKGDVVISKQPQINADAQQKAVIDKINEIIEYLEKREILDIS